MGAKYSKPRIRRRISSLRKREAPEGSNDPAPIPDESWKHGNNEVGLKVGIDDEAGNCKFCRRPDKHRDLQHDAYKSNIRDDVTTLEQRGVLKKHEERSSFEEFLKQRDLKVDLPRSPNLCRRCVNLEKSTSLPQKSASNHEENKITDKDEEHEWTITLYEIDKMSGRVPREDMVRLMSSIYDAVDSKVEEAPQGRKTVRVRLSVTPERRTQSKIHRTSSTPQRDHSRCAECPKTEPTCRRTNDDHLSRRFRGDASPPRISTAQTPADPTRKLQNSGCLRDYAEAKADGKRRNARIESIDNCQRPLKKYLESDGLKIGDRTKSAHQNKHRTWPKLEDHQKTAVSKRRPRCHGNDARTAMLKTRKKDPRFASPYDQHFQEAMYLRLRELQRQGAFEMRRATGRLQDSDDADDDSCSDNEVEKTKPSAEPKERDQKTRENGTISVNSDSALSKTKGDTSQTSNQVASSNITSVHHHHHYHHGISNGSVLSALNSPDGFAVKCVTNAANSTCSAVVPAADDNPKGHHYYHHHYHHADQ